MESVKEHRKSSHNMIARSNRKSTFKTFYFESWEKLKIQLKVPNLLTDCLFSDLSFGAWKGHWVISELSSQLNVERLVNVQPLIGIDQEQKKYVNVISQLIDNESTGDKNFLIAYEFCKKIIPELIRQNIKWIVIIPPKKGYDWEVENIQFLELLKHGLSSSNIEIVLLGIHDSNFPPHWILDIQNSNTESFISKDSFPIPGILNEELSNLFDEVMPSSCLRLKNKHSVISPLARNKTEHSPAYFIQAFKGKEEYSHLQIFFELLGLNEFSEINFLQFEAAKRFSEGGYAIALRILESIRGKAKNPFERAAIISQIQNIRIALMYFSDAAEEEIPEGDLPDEFKASLFQSKAWGLVMTNKAEEAEPYFELARKYLSEEKFPRMYMYLLNISALNKLKIGALETAFEFEKEIERKLVEQKNTDWHILYINSINQARLYKKIKDFELSQKYYLRAFEVNKFLKVESDLLYTNLCFAQLEALKGNHNSSFVFWLRTCLHWLCNETPESLAPRVSQAIFRKGLSSQMGKVEEISSHLLKYLQASISKIQLEIFEMKIPESIAFVRIQRAVQSPELAIGKKGISVFGTNETFENVYQSKTYDELKSFVYQILTTIFPPLLKYSTILTDDQLGNEIPVNSKEIISSCIRYDVSKIIFENKKYSFSVAEKLQLLLSSKINLTDAISHVQYKDENLLVFFKRYQSPVLLKKLEKEILESIHQYATIGDVFDQYGKDPNILILLRSMEMKKLITIFN